MKMGQLVKESSNLFIIHSPCHCKLTNTCMIICKYKDSKKQTSKQNLNCDLKTDANKQNNRTNRSSSIWHTDQSTFRINRMINEKIIRTVCSTNRKINIVLNRTRLDSIKINYFLKLQFFILINLIVSTRTQLNSVLSVFDFFTKIDRLIRIKNLKQVSPKKWIDFYFSIFIISNSLITCNAIKNQYNKAVGAVSGDLVLGALFPVHHAPGPAQAQARLCGAIREQYGIQRVEAAFQTIDLINKDESILPHITLGIEIRDSCWYSPIALEQSIEFIRDAMAASEEQQLKDKQLAKDKLDFETRENAFFNVNLKNITNFCPKQASVRAKNLVGVIGPASSTVTIQVQNLLQLFNIPQIGYSATSRDLSAKNYYRYFLRVVPSDLLQAQVMIELIKKNNWTFISAVYTDGNYGASLMEVFKNIAQEEGICIASTESVIHNAEDSKFDEIVTNLQEYKATAKVVLCFCEGMTVRGILKAFRRLNATGDFQLFGSDGWSDRYDVVEGYEEEAAGGLSVRIHSPYVQDFDEYYFKLNPTNNARNPWFKEFWEWKFNCTLGIITANTTVKQCTGREKLTDKYKQDTKMAFVVKAIWTMAYGLHSMQQSLCPDSQNLCKEMIPVNGSIFLQHLLNVSFEWNNEKVLFDQNGDPPGRYDIMNFQKKLNGSYDYEMIGSWVSTSRFLNFETKYVHWPNNMKLNRETNMPESVCSKPCKPGHAKNFQSDSVKCCWVCVPCRENQFLKNEYTCENCPIGWRPNVNLTGCLQIPVKYIQWSETPSLCAIAISVIGLLMTIFTMGVFIRNNNTPVVKASTKELSYLIMLGMILANCTTFFLIAKPSKFNCLITRILPGFSFAVIYGSLVTKTNRIARILAGSKKRILTKKPRFMSSASQVVISCLLICIEIGILTFTLIKEPADSMLDYPTWNQVILICNTTSLGISAPMGFDYFLIAMCTLYAVKTRNVPENFNEAKFIGFTMYTTIVIWGAFFPIYFGSNSKVISLCLCISLSAIIALVLLFFPKLYIILLKPEKNNRSFFTTARNVRCHIGYVPTLGISRHSSHSASDFSVESPRTYSVEQQHFHHKMHTNLQESRGITGGFVEAAAARALLATSTQQRPTFSVSNANVANSKSPFSFFSRLRNRKQNKIKANVEQKIRAVRAAEALDRQTNIRRSRVPPRQSSLLDGSTAGAAEESQSSIGQTSQIDTQKLKLLNLWKHAYLDELAKIPGLLEFIDNYKDNFIVIGTTNTTVGGKSRRAVSMVLPKAIENGKELTTANGTAIEKKTTETSTIAENSQQKQQQQLIADKTLDSSAGKSNTAVQTSLELLPQLRCEQNLQQQKKLQHLQNISVVKTPLSRLRPCTRTAEQKRLDYERTIAELKKQAIEVEDRINKQQKSINVDRKIDDDEWIAMDDNNNGYTRDQDIIDDSIPIIPPPPIIPLSSPYSILTRQQTTDGLNQHDQRLLYENTAALQNLHDIQNLQPADHLPTAEELILRVNRLSCEPSSINGQFIDSNNELNQLGNSTKTTTSTVRVQSQLHSTAGLAGLRSSSGSTTIFSHQHIPSTTSQRNDNATNASQRQMRTMQTNDKILNKEAAESNLVCQRVSSWSSKESALINEKDALHEQYARINLAGTDHYQSGILDEKKQKEFESKESLIIEESASENEEDSSAAIYKKIIISLRNSSTDLADRDYQFVRHSAAPSSSNQPQMQSDHNNPSHTYQTNYALFYEQMQQQLQFHREHQQSDDCCSGYFQSATNEYSAENIADEQEDELISAFSSISRSEPSSARQSRKY